MLLLVDVHTMGQTTCRHPIGFRRPSSPHTTHADRHLQRQRHQCPLASLAEVAGNPAPGPKFDFKLRWFERLSVHTKQLIDAGLPVVLAGDYNVMPTDLDVHKPERWLDDALFRPEVRRANRELLEQGWTDALRAFHPGERIYLVARRRPSNSMAR